MRITTVRIGTMEAAAAIAVVGLTWLAPPRVDAAQGSNRPQLTAPAPVSVASRSHSTVREYKKTMRTYPYADPNPIANFGLIYPYFRYDRYTNQAVDREWTVVELENAYVKVAVLPEIGGKIWSAIEKSTGRAFIYDNHVVKFRDIAMRGPWTSGGIEANYGIIGHTPNCATPVDYVTRTDADGAASVTIGTLDLLTRTSWRIEIALPADKAYFTTRSLWQNTSAIEQPYYTWMNVGLKAGGNLEFVYPGTSYLGHNGEVGAWPVHPENTKNLAFYDQNDFGPYKSYHVFGEYADFFGAYWHDDDFGMARYATRDDKLGKKIWIWGLSRQGMIWERLLTDTDGQYVEVQSGRLFNQTAEASSLTPFKHRGFAPAATDTWTEYWLPVKGTKGFVKATELGALNVVRRGDRLDLAFSPLERIDTTVEVFDGDRRLRAIPVSLTPLRPWTISIDTPVPDARLRVRIAGDRFEYVANRAEAALSRPVTSPADFDWESVYGLSLRAKELMRQRAYGEAERAVDACLVNDHNYVPALADKALLRHRVGDDDSAYRASTHALSIDTYDPAANYYYGLSALGLGKVADARDGFDVAAQSVEYRNAALTQLARIAARDRRWHAAEDYAVRSLQADPAGLEARQLLATIYRVSGRPARARGALDALLERDPLSHAARFERYRLNPVARSRQAFVSGIRNELPQETFLELAIWYHAIGRDDDARALLALAPPVAEVAYWAAYLDRARPGVDVTAALARAAAASPAMVFPFRVESGPVLQWAVDESAAWQPRYYLALLVRGRGEVDRARALMDACGDAPDFAPFYAVRAQMRTPDEAERGRADLQRAAALNPAEWRYGRLLVEGAIADGHLVEAEQLAARYHDADPANYIVGMLHARTWLLQRRYRDALGLLTRLDVLPYEGSTEGRSLYREANLMLAVEAIEQRRGGDAESFVAAAREWPENLGAGKPYPDDTDERLEDWIQVVALDARGAAGPARAMAEQIVSLRRPRAGVSAIVTALALRRLDRLADARAVIASDVADTALAAWGRRLIDGERVAPPATVSPSDETRVLAAWLGSGAP